jgi:probable rRNA maturation factor
MSNTQTNLFLESETDLDLNPDLIDKVFELICTEHKLEKGWINIIIQNTSEHNDLNIKYLNHYEPTDVITFNFNDDELISGEVYINIEIAKLNAETYKANLNLEIKRLIIHGILHLVGYDDHTDDLRAEMHGLENTYLKSFM